MSDLLYLVWQSLRYYWGRSLLLIAALALAVFVPLTLYVTIQNASRSLRQRAMETPLLIGAQGSVTDLTLRSLYFGRQPLAQIRMLDLSQVATNLAQTIPLHMRFRVTGAPIVGTTRAYISYRRLSIAEGEQWQRLGDCILGHTAARTLRLGPGDSLMSESDSIMNLAGTYPLLMRVSGVLSPTGTADDDAVFVELETAWVMEGIGHGHARQAAERDEPHETARSYTEVTNDNLGSFHFHGSKDSYPLTSAIVLPIDVRALTLLVGQFESRQDKSLQLVEPSLVIDELLRSILRMRTFLMLGGTLVGLATAALAGLVFSLSFKLREKEFETLKKIGASPRRIAGLFVCECLVVTSVSLLLALSLTLFASQFNYALIRWLL